VSRPSAKDTNPEYWLEYNNLQQTKHRLIHEYLNGWLPKLGSWSGRILYLDTHAGRGRHATGVYGSPLVALQTLLDHSFRERVFGKCEVVFSFIEIDEENCEELRSEIRKLGDLPKQVKLGIVCGDCFQTLESVIRDLEKSGSSIAPAFVFVDPYGFKVPAAILRKLMNSGHVELFVNVIWRELSMAIAQGETTAGMARTLDLIFDGDDWRKLIGLQFEKQAEACINLLRSKIGAKWATHIRMLGANNATRYMLMHLTNHDSGRDLMKDCMWEVCPDGGFLARVTDDVRQEQLVTAEPDLGPLRKWLIAELTAGARRWNELIEKLRPEIWRAPQLNQIVMRLRRDGRLDGRDYKGRFAPANNPELFLK
jgi:three-Cys-motif partner protein